MRFEIKDPLLFSAINSGQVSAPTTATGADGGKNLDTAQRSVELGEAVPIIFARRVNDKGGVLVSPGASEARFENYVYVPSPELPPGIGSNTITAHYLLPLSEGIIDDIPVKDVFQAACRVGTFTQTYDRRAGTWVPGNYVSRYNANQTPADFPQFCGSVGLYPGITTLSFKIDVPYQSDEWNKQVHIFIRGGIHVTRLLDSVVGPSNNFADLMKWMLLNTARVPAALIDNASLLTAATFLNVNDFTCNIWIQESVNYEEFVGELASYFLVRQTKINGKRGLLPLLPVNANGTINVSPVNWSYIFTEELIVSGSFELEFTSYVDRQPFVAQMIWRQQPDDDIGIVRTAEVRYAGTATDGPYETHDLSAFCTNEIHAVKVGAYILSNRVNSTHIIRFVAAPEAHTYLLSAGSVIRVKLERYGSGSGQSQLDFLYTVIKVSQTYSGEVSYECAHLPVDEQGRSIVALDVANATGTGFTIVTTRAGVSCDAPRPSGGGGGSRETDDSVPEEEFIEPEDIYDPSTWEEADIEYRWLLNDVAIPGATGEFYTPVLSDVGDELQQEITYPDGTVVVSDPYVVQAGDVGVPLSFVNGLPGGTDSSILGGAETLITAGTTELGSIASSGGGVDSSGGSIDNGEGSGPTEAGENPTSGLNGQVAPSIATPSLTSSGNINQPTTGDVLTAPVICTGGRVSWYRLDPSVQGGRVYVTQGPSYTMVINDKDYSIYAEIECPDPSSPTGYAEPVQTTPTPIVKVVVPGLENVTFAGSYSPTGTTSWTQSGTWNGYLSGSCSPYNQNTSGSGSFVDGITAMRTVEAGLTGCNKPNSITIQRRNSSGTWFSFIGISGAGGWDGWTGSFTFSSTAPDAVPAENLKYQ